MVMNAHAIAAKTEATWLRVEMVILKFLFVHVAGLFRYAKVIA
jgi:hypothetical protein